MRLTCSCDVNRQVFGPSHHNVDHHESSLKIPWWQSRYPPRWGLWCTSWPRSQKSSKDGDVHDGQQDLPLLLHLRNPSSLLTMSLYADHLMAPMPCLSSFWTHQRLFKQKLCQNETPAGRLEFLAPRRLRRDWLLNVGVDTLEEGGTVDTGVGEPLCGYSGFLELAQWSRRCSWWLTCLAG